MLIYYAHPLHGRRNTHRDLTVNRWPNWLTNIVYRQLLALSRTPVYSAGLWRCRRGVHRDLGLMAHSDCACRRASTLENSSTARFFSRPSVLTRDASTCVICTADNGILQGADTRLRAQGYARRSAQSE
jgi:hypothetical protein